MLRPVPDGVLSDLPALRRIVMQRKSEAEFLLDYDGIRFRCTRNDQVSAVRAVLKLVSGHEDTEMAQEVLADGLLGILHQELRRKLQDGVVVLSPVTTPLLLGSSSGGA